MSSQLAVGRLRLQGAQRAIGALARSVAVAALAGFAAGLVAGGIGSRIAMRVVAITAGSAEQGAITDAEATVGEITGGGTIFLLILGGAIGGFGGLAYLGLRRWVADAGRWRGLAFGVLLVAMFGWGIIEGDNPDFDRFGSPALNIVMFASLFVIFGLLVAPVFEWTERRLPPRFVGVGGLTSLAAHGLGLLIALPILGGLINGFGEEGDRRLFFTILPAYVLLVPPITARFLGAAAGRFERLSDLSEHRPALGAAVAVLALPVAVGLVLDVQAIRDIF